MQQISDRIAREMPEIQRLLPVRRVGGCGVKPGPSSACRYPGQRADMAAAYEIATRIGEELRKEPGVQDVYIPQDLDYPALRPQYQSHASGAIRPGAEGNRE